MRGRARFIAINESWRLCPWADVLYACDGAWWRKHRGAPEFGGLKVTYEAAAAAQFDLMRAEISWPDDVILTDGRMIGNGGNGGFQALNLALNWRARRILLVGYDMTLRRGVHWHGEHEHGLNNPREHNIRRWLSARWTVPDGVEVINCCQESGLDAFPKMSFEQAIAQ